MKQDECRLAGEAGQVRAARRFVAGLLGDDWPDADEAMLLTSELAANAVLHSASGRPGGKFTVRASVQPRDFLWVEVEDEGGPWTETAGDGERGRGLDIVNAIADEWGKDGGPATGWIVWARVDWSSGMSGADGASNGRPGPAPLPPRSRAEERPSDAAKILRWLEFASVPVVALEDEDVVEWALSAIALRLDGKAAAATVGRRKRAVFYNVLDMAATGKRRILARNPLDTMKKWKPPEVAEKVDRRVVANPRQAAELLIALSYVGGRDRNRGHRLVAMFACMYYAALRPAEAVNLHKADCELPDDGWGRVYLSKTTPEVGKRYTDSGELHDSKGLKHRPDDEVRPVPIPPELVAILRWHTDEFGVAPDGRLFRQSNGGIVSSSTYAQVWRAARVIALTPDQAVSPLAGRPYDLRHAAVSLWLNAGVPAPTVARRAGHSVDVLLRVYANCIDGDEEIANQRISGALS